jgi:serine/threonine protein phosphatase PrpC
VATPRFQTVVTVHAATPRSAGHDRAEVLHRSDAGITIALADGAGGTGRGAAAAEAVLAAVAGQHDHPAATNPWPTTLLVIDDPSRTAGGESTAVVLTVTPTRITGASIGDSGAWLVSPPGSVVELTAGQRRKPLVGAGSRLPAHSIDHAPIPPNATLLVASDGLFSHARPADIVRILATLDAPAASSTALSTAAIALVDLVRLSSGALADDVSIVLCRRVT